MIRHCVFAKFRADLPDEEKAAVYDDLRAMVGKMAGLEAGSFGPNVSPEGLGKGFEDGFILDFRDAAARDAYLDHPEHRKAAQRLLAAVEGGADGLIVFDLAI